MTSGIAKLGLWLRAVAALILIVALAAGVPWLLLKTVANPVPGGGWSWAQPVTNEAILGLIAVIAWLFWAQMMVCLLIEMAAELRLAAGRSADWMTKIPGTFGSQQNLARVLVQAVVAVGIGAAAVATPATVSFARADSIDQVASAAGGRLPAFAAFDSPSKERATPALPANGSDPDRQRTRTIEVTKGDTLWSIAERHLGSGEHWRRIADLNDGRLMPDGERFVQASSIRPGWQLLLPAPRGHTATTQLTEVTVLAEDTLWGLAEEAYGDGHDWTRIYDANRDQITDPDLIYPGQVLDVPNGDIPSADRQTEPEQRRDRRPPSTSPAQDLPEVAPPRYPEAIPGEDVPSAAPETTPVSPEHVSETDGAETSDQAGDGHLTAALVGGGGLLAGGALAVLLARRRTQLRARRSGRTIASTPAELLTAEAILRSTGSAGGVSARFLDRALRDLSSRLARMGAALPEVSAVRLGDDRLELLLASPPAGQPPVPWTEDGPRQRWTLTRGASLEDCDALAPYPALVAIGTADDGATWLLDLEAAGLVRLVGDRGVCEDLARFIGAELALNVWSDDVDVTLASFAEELVGLNPARLQYADQPDVATLIKAVRRVHDGEQVMRCDVLGGRVDGGGGDTWMPTIQLIDVRGEAHRLRDDIDRLLDEFAKQPGRDAVALMVIGDTALLSGGTALRVDKDRKIELSPWQVQLTANQLTITDARVIASLLDAADHTEDEPMPSASGAQPFEEVSDAAGGLRVELTEPRNGEGTDESLLPLADEEYLAAAATTPADLAALAPKVPRAARSRALSLEASLDEDLAAWSDPASSRPRLRLLGPVELRAAGERKPDVDRRGAYYIELVAYLATRDHGATPQQVAEAFHVQTNTLHSRIAILRKWLGTDPVTGDWYLPESTLSPSGKARGVPVYEVVGLLCDAGLFKRLRLRGQARGPAGVEDLVAALRLVDGVPFDQLRPGGYGWLADAPHDQYLTAGVVDVAHIVATHALADGDGDLALWASERAIAAAPSEDKPRLDLARALSVLGRTAEADEYVAAQIHNRSDDGGPPPNPSIRMTEVLQALGWRHRAE